MYKVEIQNVWITEIIDFKEKQTASLDMGFKSFTVLTQTGIFQVHMSTDAIKVENELKWRPNPRNIQINMISFCPTELEVAVVSIYEELTELTATSGQNVAFSNWGNLSRFLRQLFIIITITLSPEKSRHLTKACIFKASYMNYYDFYLIIFANSIIKHFQHKM